MPVGKGENPLRVAAREATSRPPADDADALAALTKRLETLGQLLDEAKEQVTSYLLHRESQSSADDAAKALARKLDALAERIEQGSGGRGLDQKLDALYGKIDQLANAIPRGGSAAAASGDGGGPGVSEAALKSAVRPVGEKLEQFEAKLKSIDALKEALVAAITKLRDSHAEQHNAQSAGIRQLGEMVPQYFNAMAAVLHGHPAASGRRPAARRCRAAGDPRNPSSAAARGGAGRARRRRRLARGPPGRRAGPQPGPERRQEPACSNGVLSGDPGACGLVGSLLLFRAAAADKMPPLLKDIGEAFYRWQPKTSNRPSELEKALVEWLMRACDQAGMANTIELVNPGERFDSLRHNASRPGVEITQVLGWIVLRDNGKVYTKASVAVK